MHPDNVSCGTSDEYEQRALSAASTFDGMGVGSWTLHPVGHETVMTALHAFSQPISGDDRSPAQRRADALITIAEIALAAGQGAETGGIKPHVTVVLDLATLENRAGAPAASYGYGTISSPGWAQRICCDAGISRIITDGTSEILNARPHHPHLHRQPTPSGHRPRPALHLGRLRPARRLVRSPPPGTLVRRWRHQRHNGVLVCGRHHDRLHLHQHAIIIDPNGKRRIDRRPGSAKHRRRARRRRRVRPAIDEYVAVGGSGRRRRGGFAVPDVATDRSSLAGERFARRTRTSARLGVAPAD